MANCPNCNSKLATQKIVKSFLSLKSYPPIACKNCRMILSHKINNRLYGGLAAILGISVGLLYINLNNLDVKNMLIGIILAGISLVLSSIFITNFLHFEKQ